MLTFAEGKPRWKSTHKVHYIVAHVADQAALLNPRYVQGYGVRIDRGSDVQCVQGIQEGASAITHPRAGHVEVSCRHDTDVEVIGVCKAMCPLPIALLCGWFPGPLKF